MWNGLSSNKGLNTDIAPENLPDGVVRYALNAVYDRNHNGASNEGGAKLLYTYDEGYKEIGNLYIDDNDYIIFLVSDTNSVIARYKDGSVTNVVKDPDLNFSVDSYVSATFKVSNNGDIIIYFNFIKSIYTSYCTIINM